MADHLDFVPRIRAQLGLFVELPSLGLDKFDPAAAPSAEHFYQHLRDWRPELFREHDPAFVSSARWLAGFHFRLQSLPTLRTFERSPTRLRSAYGKLAFAAQEGRSLPKRRDYVDYYLSQSGDESQNAIRSLWDTMCVELGPEG